MLSKILSKNKKGFTLIEILIVVLIIGILAALLLPKLLSSPRRAAIAEGIQMLGAIRRAQITYKATTGSYLGIGAANDENWTRLGLGALNTNASKFSYSCDGNHCRAVAVGAAAPGRMGIELDHGFIDCSNGYTEITSPAVVTYADSGSVVSCRA